MKKNECVTAALKELSAAGIRDIEHAFSGKHQQIHWKSRSNGASRVFTLPLSPSDGRAAANTRAEIRRILREDGMLPPAEHKPPPPPPPKAPDRVTLIERRVTALEQCLSEFRRLVGDLIKETTQEGAR